jgi:hypothetical protein
MTGILLAVLQIFLLLLRAHFSKESSREKAINSIRQAQSKLDEIADQFELKLRYSAPSVEQVHQLQDLLDKDKNTQSRKPASK